MTRVVRVAHEHRVEHECEYTRTQELLVADRSVLRVEPLASGGREQRPDEHEIDARVSETHVSPVDNPRDITAGDEHVAHVQVAVGKHELARRCGERGRGREDAVDGARVSPEPELLQHCDVLAGPGHAKGHVGAAVEIDRQSALRIDERPGLRCMAARAGIDPAQLRARRARPRSARRPPARGRGSEGRRRTAMGTARSVARRNVEPGSGRTAAERAGATRPARARRPEWQWPGAESGTTTPRRRARRSCPSPCR